MAEKLKYARYRIVQNSESSYWKYQVQRRVFWPILPFWFDEHETDSLSDAHNHLERLKSKSKVVYVE